MRKRGPPLREAPRTKIARGAAAAGLVLVLGMTGPAPALAGEVRWGGGRAELAVSAAGERTVGILLSPLDPDGKARTAPLRACSKWWAATRSPGKWSSEGSGSPWTCEAARQRTPPRFAISPWSCDEKTRAPRSSNGFSRPPNSPETLYTVCPPCCRGPNQGLHLASAAGSIFRGSPPHPRRGRRRRQQDSSSYSSPSSWSSVSYAGEQRR
jgi:hypothetical protein